MKKNKNLFLLVTVIFGAVLLFSSIPAAARPIELSLSLVTPPAHLRNINVIRPWIKMLEERSGGKLKVTPYYANALASFREQYDAAVKGIADISEGLVFATPGRFPLTEMTQLPGLGTDLAVESSKVFWDAYKTFPAVQAEWRQVKLLWIHVNGNTYMIFKKKEVRTLEDLKGLKCSVTGSVSAKAGEALGFTPVAMPMSDVYLALEKGVIDGAIAKNELLISRRFGEVSKYIVDNFNMGASTFFVAMNNNTWKRLPDDIKKVFEELSGDWGQKFTAEAWDRFDDEAREKMKAKGYGYIYLTPDEKARWMERIEPVKREYAESLDAKGLPGTKLLKVLDRSK